MRLHENSYVATWSARHRAQARRYRWSTGTLIAFLSRGWRIPGIRIRITRYKVRGTRYIGRCKALPGPNNDPRQLRRHGIDSEMDHPAEFDG